MSWAYDQAVRLLNDAKVATDGASKLQLLQQLGELLFRKEPALVPQFSAALLELQAEPAGAVRKFLASVLDALAGSSVHLVAPCASAAICLIRDSQAAVVKAALLSGTGVLRLTVVLACKQGGGVPQPEVAAAWSASRALFAEACSLAVSSDNSGVKLQAIKFVEAAALAYSAALSMPALLNAPFASDLRDGLHVAIEVVTRLLGSVLAGPSAVVLIDAAGNLARQRPLLVPELLPPLLRFAQHVAAAGSSSQAASMAHALKGALVQLLRSGVLASGAWQEGALSSLKAMGHQEVAEQAVRQSERSLKRERTQLDRDQDAAAYEDDAPPAAKRAVLDSRGPGAEAADVPPSTDPGLLLQVVAALAALASGGDLATLSAFVTQLSAPVLADVVIYNMQHLSATPPGLHSGMEAAMPGVMALFGAPAPAPAPMPSAAVVPAVSEAVAAPPASAAAPIAAAPPAPLVAQPLGTEVRAAQRLAAATRILRSDEHRIVTAAGGDAFRCALLGRVGAHAPPRFDGELLEYVLVDYPGRQGHAHLIQWLYCLYADDLMQPPRKKKGYDEGLLAAARAMLQKLSARDKALPTLFVDAPVLPSSAMGILEWLVGLGQGEDGAAASMEQRTLGLITLRDIVMHRQAERSACLALVLRCTVHVDDALRGKAIRMVVNQLHPLAYAALQVESFAGEQLDSVLQLQPASGTEATAAAPDYTEEALRRISLYFALCTRAETLLPRLFEVYAASGPVSQPAFHRNMAGLARTLGPEAPTLLQLIQSPPSGSEELALQTFQALCNTDAGFPPQLIQAGRSAYEATKQDVRFLLPCLSALEKEELRVLLPQIVALSTDDVVSAFRRILDVGAGVSPVMSAAEIVVALHHIEASDALPLKKVMDACSACFSPELRDLFTPDSLAVALQQLVELVRLPVLFMRTVIQTATVAPKLHSFILELLSKLVLKQVWKTDTKLWQGLLRCAKQLVPRSFPVYLQLPAAQLKEALAQSPDLVAPLSAYAATPAVRSTVPGAIRDVLAEVSEVERAAS